MGYHLNSVYSIATDDKHAYFVFMLGGSHRLVNATQEWLDKNFGQIAGALGPKAVIVRGLSPDFDAEVVDRYHEQIETRVLHARVDERTIDEIAMKVGKKYRVRLETPLLLVTDRNPHRLGPDEKGMVFYMIPVGGLPEPDVQAVVETILRCITVDDFKELDQWIHAHFGSASLNLLAALNDAVEVKLELPLISINLNSIIKHLTKKGAAFD